MKTSFLAVVLSLFAFDGLSAEVANDAPVSQVFVSERGPHHRAWQRVTIFTNALGNTITTTNPAYMELATGLHYQNDGQWMESKEEIVATAGGAAATNGQHQAYFPSDIYNGVIELVTPDGLHLKSRPLGLSYFDGTNTVLIAELTNSIGQILPSGNQVIYTNAFTDFAADLVGTYRKSGFESDVVFRQRPPAPEQFGLSSQNCRLMLLTEFFDAPDPVQSPAPMNQTDGLIDNTLSFGATRMGHGRAFLIGDSPLPFQAALRGIPVYKSWEHLEGRTFLIEELPYRRIEPQLQQLQASTRSTFMASADSVRHKVSKSQLLPPRRLAQRGTNALQVAQVNLNQKPGLVIDYVTINSNQSTFTFRGDSTYYVNGTYHLYGTTTIEGGTVIKGGGSSELYDEGTIDWQTGPYRPAIFTSKNDDSVGEPISGSSGNPQINDVYIHLATFGGVRNARFAYGTFGVWMQTGSGTDIWDSQFVHCDYPLYADQDLFLHNVLIADATGYAIVPLANLKAEHLTVDNSEPILGEFTSLYLTNCLFVDSGNGWDGSPPVVSNCLEVIPSSEGMVFQTVGAGARYLADNSPYRNAGTTNINSTLRSNLRNKTTYPPIAFTNTTLSADTTWLPQAQRDTDMPDLGYHYDPIDYAINYLTVNTTLTLGNGVAVAAFQGGAYGFLLSGSKLISTGTPLLHNQVCMYQAVQEQPMEWGGGSLPGTIIMSFLGVSPYAGALDAQFTDFNGIAGLGQIVQSDTMQLKMRDCRVGPGMFQSYVYDGSDTNLCINNLFERASVIFDEFDGNSPLTFCNNLVRYGGVTFTKYDEIYNWEVRDNLFDNCSIGGAGVTHDHNGYVNTAIPGGSGGNDKNPTVANYQTGPLGKYYYPGSGTNLYLLVNAGSRSASDAALYHFTTQTNLIKETNSTVDIGFHYVATSASGIPIDTDGDGVPDYLEDANGNESVNSGETDWRSASDLGLKVWITRPRSNSPIP